MINEWIEATEQETAFTRRSCKWYLILNVFTAIGIIPMSILGAIHIYQLFMPFAESLGDKILFYFIELCLAILIVITAYSLFYMIGKYKKINGTLLKGMQGTVLKTWEQREGKSTVSYYSFLYKDPVTGLQKEHKSNNIGKKEELLEPGDELFVLAKKTEQGLVIVESCKQGIVNKMNNLWLIYLGAVPVVLWLENALLYMEYGAMAIYFRFITYILVAATIVMLVVFGIVHKKFGTFLAAALLAAVLVIFDVPAVMKNIAADLKEGPATLHTAIKMDKITKTTRTRRGGTRKTTRYYFDFYTKECNLGMVEVTPAYFHHYNDEGAYIHATITYYKNSNIFISIESVDD